MKETLVLSVAGLLLTNVLADVLYRKRGDGALGQLSYGFLLAAAIVPAVFGQWNSPLPWLIVLGFAIVEFISALISKQLPRFAFRHLFLAAVAITLSAMDPDQAHRGVWYSALDNWTYRFLFWKSAAMVSGIILCVFTGGSLVAAVIRLLLTEDEIVGMQGLPHGGRIIGWLERSIVMLLIWMQQAEGIGFLVAAKSILRFDDISHQRKTTEYVIIGTFLSFGWAMLVTMVLQKVLLLWP